MKRLQAAGVRRPRAGYVRTDPLVKRTRPLTNERRALGREVGFGPGVNKICDEE